MKGFGFNRI